MQLEQMRRTRGVAPVSFAKEESELRKNEKEHFSSRENPRRERETFFFSHKVVESGKKGEESDIEGREMRERREVDREDELM